jgi:hypothetical protein
MIGLTTSPTSGSNNLTVNRWLGLGGVTNPIRTLQIHSVGGGPEMVLSSTLSSSSGFINLCDTTGNNGSTYSLTIRGLSSSGSSQVNLNGFTVLTTAAVIGGIYGTTTSGGSAVYVNSSGLLGTGTSLREAKTNITPVSNAAWLNDLTPVTFNYRLRNEDKSYSDEFEPSVEFGLIAEDVEAIDNRFCFYADDGKLLGVRYEKLIIPMLKAIQELKAEFDAYKASHP